MRSASVGKQVVAMLEFLNLLALSRAFPCLYRSTPEAETLPTIWGGKKNPCVGEVLYAVSFQGWLALQYYNWQVTTQNTESEGEPSKRHEKHKPRSLMRNEASKSARADVAVSMGEPPVFPFVTLFIL